MAGAMMLAGATSEPRVVIVLALINVRGVEEILYALRQWITRNVGPSVVPDHFAGKRASETGRRIHDHLAGYLGSKV